MAAIAQGLGPNKKKSAYCKSLQDTIQNYGNELLSENPNMTYNCE